MNKFALILFSFITINSFSQELVKNIRFKIPQKSDLFQIIEEDNKRVSLFFTNKIKTTSVRFDKDFNIIDSLSYIKPEKKFNEIVGYSISDNKYYTYWSASNNKEFVSQCFDFSKKVTLQKSYTLDSGKEQVIKKTTINNIFYLITITKNSNILNFYVFKDGNYSKRTVDMSERVFYDKENKDAKLWSIFNTITTMENYFGLQTISNDSPASLTFSGSKRKCYDYNNNFIITLDNNNQFTQFISINLNDFSFNYQIFDQPKIIENVDASSDSNSFVLEKNIVQMNLNSDNLVIVVKDFNNQDLKSYQAFDNKEIDFKNSEIYQENKSVKSVRVLDKSNQFLRKIYHLNPSLSCYSNNGVNYLTIGSVSSLENNNNGAMMVGGMFGLAGALIAVALTSNYSMNNLNSYQGRKVVYINCMFDDNFNHINGDAKKLAFDKLRNFVEENKKLTSQTIFKFDSALLFGGFNKETNYYSFYKFVD
ncbi:MAG: hypothetical protein V4548_06620 [Bacteroidota bacterium]